MTLVKLELTDDEARRVWYALGITVDLLAQVEPAAGAVLSRRDDSESLTLVARRLSHERRHRGAVPNPNGPA